jgi:hypothetical protein
VVWIDKGIYKGFGYAPFHFHGKEPMHWARYINTEKENRDNKSIVSYFLRSDKNLRIVQLNAIETL